LVTAGVAEIFSIRTTEKHREPFRWWSGCEAQPQRRDLSKDR
jgi:hypothetical protein